MANQSSDNSVNIGCCKTRLCRMCHIQEYPPYCNAEVFWGHNVCWLESKVSKRMLNWSVPPMSSFDICALLKENSFFLFFLIVQEAATPVMLCEWNTTTIDSCPWIIPMSLMCESFYNIFLWVNIHYGVNFFDIRYVRLHIGASVGHTMYHDGGPFDNRCAASRCTETRTHVCLCSSSHQSYIPVLFHDI